MQESWDTGGDSKGPSPPSHVLHALNCTEFTAVGLMRDLLQCVRDIGILMVKTAAGVSV